MFLIYSQVKYEYEKWSFRMKTDFDISRFYKCFHKYQLEHMAFFKMNLVISGHISNGSSKDTDVSVFL